MSSTFFPKKTITCNTDITRLTYYWKLGWVMRTVDVTNYHTQVRKSLTK